MNWSDLIFNPNEFFRRQHNVQICDMRLPLTIMSSVTVLAGVALTIYQLRILAVIRSALDRNYYLPKPALDAMLSGLATIRNLSVSTVWIQGLLVPFSWLAATAAIFALAILFGAKGDFRALLRLTGLAYAPYIIFLAATLIVVGLGPLPADLGLEIEKARSAEEFARAVAECKTVLKHSLVVQLVLNLNLVFQVWIAALWSSALSVVEKLSLWKSGPITVTAVGFIYAASHLFQWLG